MAEVRYCYRCGRRVRDEHKDCWYCGVPLHRKLREPRRCPYCDRVVRLNAIKCHHCGEFLDQPVTAGHERSERGPTFVIDKAVIQNVRGKGGRSKPRLIAASEPRRLEGGRESPRALEPPSGYESGGERSRAAPAREEEDVQTAEFFEIERSGEGPTREGRSREADANLPAVRGKSSRQERQLPAQPKPSHPLKRAEPHETVPPNQELDSERPRVPPGGPAHPRTAAEAAEASPFRICPICGTEILRTDNFCYHCGQKYARERFSFTSTARGRGDWRLYAGIILLWIPHLLYYLPLGKAPAWLILGSAFAALALCMISLIKWPRNPNRRFTLVLFAFTVLIATAPVILVL